MPSTRLPWDRPENDLAALERDARARGRALLDLTLSNPTQAGLPYPTAALRTALAPDGAAVYAPAPRGLPEARAAVAADYAASGATIAADQIVVTSGSSESYAHLFKLLCDPGDAVLVPEPSYPLFEYLARLEGVVPVPYRLAFDGEWHIDFASVEQALGRARALVVVNPNNPTGSFVKRDELAPLARACAAAGVAVISDEVFAAYAHDDAGGGAARARAPTLAAEPVLTSDVLTVSLGGLSKSCGLPQLKLAWMAVAGPPARAAEALAGLELIADTYLSVATPVQLAAPRLLALGREVRAAIRARVAGNRAHLRAALPASSPCTLLPSEGGWSAILRVPATRADDAWAAELLAEDDVLVQPGYFFDMRGGAFLVLSLLPEAAVFEEATRRIIDRCNRA